MSNVPSKEIIEADEPDWKTARRHFLYSGDISPRDSGHGYALLVEIERLTADGESTRQALRQVTAAYDKLLKRMGAVRAAIGTDPHFEPGSQS